MTTFGIIFIAVIAFFATASITWLISRDYHLGRQSAVSKWTSLSFKYNYKVIFKDKNSLLIEEVSPQKRRYLIGSNLVNDAVRPGMEVKLAPNNKEMKLAGLYDIASLGPLVRTS